MGAFTVAHYNITGLSHSIINLCVTKLDFVDLDFSFRSLFWHISNLLQQHQDWSSVCNILRLSLDSFNTTTSLNTGLVCTESWPEPHPGPSCWTTTLTVKLITTGSHWSCKVMTDASKNKHFCSSTAHQCSWFWKNIFKHDYKVQTEFIKLISCFMFRYWIIIDWLLRAEGGKAVMSWTQSLLCDTVVIRSSEIKTSLIITVTRVKHGSN